MGGRDEKVVRDAVVIATALQGVILPQSDAGLSKQTAGSDWLP